jgi:hypothetical protein
MEPGPRRTLAAIVVAAALCAIAASQDSRAVPAPESRDARAAAIDAALDWLKRHQSPDGSWMCAGFGASCEEGSRCSGPGKPEHDAGVTGLALLAFLGAGHDPARRGTYLDTVRNGLKFLKAHQDAHGNFARTDDPRHTYSHAVATMAMCDAFAASKQLPWRKSAEQAVEYIYKCQNPYKAWRYGVQPGDNDASVTGLMLAALTAAGRAGVPVSGKSRQDGLAFLDSITDEETGRTGYLKKGEPPVAPQGHEMKFSLDGPQTPTAIAICSRLDFGITDSPILVKAANLVTDRVPVWSTDNKSVDMAYWYWGARAMNQLGGAPRERWNRALLDVAVAHQKGDRAGCAAGSWNPVDAWGLEGGRVYSTAIMALALQMADRLPSARDPFWLAQRARAARKADPIAFIDDAMVELRKHDAAFEQAKTYLPQAATKLAEMTDETERRLKSNADALEGFRSAFEATGGRTWPLPIGGRSYSEAELVSQVDSLLAERSNYEDVRSQLEKSVRMLEDKRKEFDRTHAKVRELLASLPFWRKGLESHGLDPDWEKTLDETHALLEKLEASTRVDVRSTEDLVRSATESRRRPTAAEFLNRKPESRK